MIGMKEILLLQAMLLTNISDLVTGNFLGPIAKSMWLVILTTAKF